MLAHSVYFTLKDRSPEAAEGGLLTPLAPHPIALVVSSDGIWVRARPPAVGAAAPLWRSAGVESMMRWAVTATS